MITQDTIHPDERFISTAVDKDHRSETNIRNTDIAASFRRLSFLNEGSA